MKTVLILGAYSDIAVAIAKKYASEGYALILAGRTVEKLEKLKGDIRIKFNNVVAIREFDAFDFASHAAFYSSLGAKPDITICVFGYLGDQVFAQDHWEEAYSILTANYIGAVSILNIVADDYEKRGSGCIIGVSSVAGERGRQSNYLYGSAKGGFSIYLDGLRNRLYKHHVHVLTIKPGFAATKMTEHLNLPTPLTAQPEQVAKAIYKAYLKKKNIIYVLPIWNFLMLIIKSIPEPIFKKLNL